MWTFVILFWENGCCFCLFLLGSFTFSSFSLEVLVVKDLSEPRTNSPCSHHNWGGADGYSQIIVGRLGGGQEKVTNYRRCRLPTLVCANALRSLCCRGLSQHLLIQPSSERDPGERLVETISCIRKAGIPRGYNSCAGGERWARGGLARLILTADCYRLPVYCRFANKKVDEKN